jgi:hypothetical protein
MEPGDATLSLATLPQTGQPEFGIVQDRTPMTLRYAQQMANVRPSAIGELLALGADPSIISYGGGSPHATLFPTDQLDSFFHDII